MLESGMPQFESRADASAQSRLMRTSQQVIRARAPLRISFAGGGTDVPPYCDERGGAILSATINRYACASATSGGGRLAVQSLDYDATISYGIDDPFVYDGQLDLAKGVLDHFRKTAPLHDGLDIALHNAAPPGSGLGSSSAITVALARLVSEYLRISLDPYQLADLAYRIERLEVGIKGGKQDHYSAAFGGFNYIEFYDGIAVVNPLRLRAQTLYELEYRMVVAYVGGSHFSSHIIERQVSNYQNAVDQTLRAMDDLKRLAFEMKQALLRGRIDDFGAMLDASWQAKKQMADGITDPRIDEIYDAARKGGALGGKITGAGGGGFMFFLSEAKRLFSLQSAIKTQGAQLVDFSFVDEGVHAWTMG